MPAGLGDFPELEVDGFYRVRGVHDFAEFGWVVQERDELGPGPAPHVDHAGVLAAPFGVEVLQGDLGSLDARRGVDRLHRLRDLLAVLIGHKPHRVTDHVHDAGLHDGFGKDAGDGVGEPGEAVAAGDQDVAQAAVAQLGEHGVPELRALGLGDPAAQGVLTAVDVDADDQVGGLDRHCALVSDLDPDPVDVDDRVHLVDRTVAPDLDFVGHHIGNVRHHFPGRCHAVHLEQVRFDVAGGHSAGVAGQHELVDLSDSPGAFRHDPRLELSVPVARHGDRDRPVGRRHRFRRAAVARIPGSVAGWVVAVITQVVSHLGLQGTFEDGLGNLIQQSVDPVNRGAGGLRIGEQSVDHGGVECLGEPAGRLGLNLRIGLVLDHVGVLPDRRVDHSGRSWSTRGLHTCHDTPDPGPVQAARMLRTEHASRPRPTEPEVELRSLADYDTALGLDDDLDNGGLDDGRVA